MQLFCLDRTTLVKAQETITSCPSTGACSRQDSRGIDWFQYFGKTATKNCTFGSGQAFWFCDGCMGDFSTPEPDRSSCIDPWIEEIESMLGYETALYISEALLGYLVCDNCTESPYAGSFLRLGENILPRVLDQRRDEIEGGEGGGARNQTKIRKGSFTSNIINSTNQIFGSAVGWNEITELETRRQVVTQYLEVLDYTGYLWAKKKSGCSAFKSFIFSEIQLISKLVKRKWINETECYTFDSGSICIPRTQLEVYY